jgi:hypothetical protein
VKSLQGPSLDASREQWEAWHSQLLAMNSRAPSVAVALQRAQAVLAEGQVTPAPASRFATQPAPLASGRR